MIQILLPVIFGLFTEKNEEERPSKQTSRPNFILRVLLNLHVYKYYYFLLKCTHSFGRINLKILHCLQICNFDLSAICHGVRMYFQAIFYLLIFNISSTLAINTREK